jgi:hypothetical protein
MVLTSSGKIAVNMEPNLPTIPALYCLALVLPTARPLLTLSQGIMNIIISAILNEFLLVVNQQIF